MLQPSLLCSRGTRQQHHQKIRAANPLIFHLRARQRSRSLLSLGAFVCSQPPCASCHCCLAVRVLSTTLCCTLSVMSRVVLIVDRCAVERPSRRAVPRYAMHTHILLTCTFLRTERRLFKHYGMFEFLLQGKRPVALTVLTLPVVPPPLPPPLDESVAQEDWLINNPPSDKDSVRNTPPTPPRCRCCRGTVYCCCPAVATAAGRSAPAVTVLLVLTALPAHLCASLRAAAPSRSTQCNVRLLHTHKHCCTSVLRQHER
jgi:hypothetical protein